MQPRERCVCGIGPVRELLKRRAKSISVLYVADTNKTSKAHHDLTSMARDRAIPVERRPRHALDALVGPHTQHQGIVALTDAYRYASVDDLLTAAAHADTPGLWIAADGITDPQNLGSMVRSAHALGAHGLLIPERRAAHVTAAVTKASAGATEHLPIAMVTNLARALTELKEAGAWIVGLAAGGHSVPLWQIQSQEPTCLVVGSEGKGLRPLVRRHCDILAEIPMIPGGVGSLNASMAVAVALYEVTRARAHAVS